MTRPPVNPMVLPNFAEMLWAGAAMHGDAPAIIERERTTTHRQLRERAAAIASTLTARGLAPEQRVGILLDRGADAAAAFFGIAAAGGIAININETLRPRQIEYVLEHSDASFLITSAELMARQPREIGTTATRLMLDEIPASGSWTPVPKIGTDVAHIIYTSGSTGLPKGVTISHGNIWAGMESVATYTRIAPGDRIASLLPFSFDYGLNQLLTTIGRGAALVVERSPIPQVIVEALRTHGVTVLPCVPPLWLQLLAVESFQKRPIPSLRAMTNTGGRVPLEAVRGLRAAQPQAELFLMYGLTEAFRSTFLPPEEADRRPDSIGKAIPGAEIMVVREDGTRCGPNEPGELVHRGPTVSLGYWKDPEITNRIFRPNPLRPKGTMDLEKVVYSGDVVRMDEEGFLYYVGRRDTLIKTMGFRVSPDEVASVLYASGAIVESIILSEPDEQRGERIVAYVVLKPEGSVDQLKAFCATELPRYMQPARYEVRDSLPRTSSGKFDPKALKQPVAE
ncbi:MAG TPA: AMP-binding protein [Gemmatimonadales bacterium]|nr:AMP-binding protein [Gemmatimonadales bacterium]